MTTVAKHFLENHHITVNDKQVREIQTVLGTAFEVFIHRVVTIVAMIALVKGSRKVTEAHVKEALSVLAPRTPSRAKMHGGTVMAGDFYGVPHPSYGAGYLDTNATTVNFSDGTARPELDMSGGGVVSTHHAIILQMIKDNLKLHNVSANKTAVNAMNAFVSKKVHELAAKLKQSGTITKTKLHSVLDTKRFVMMN